MRQRYVVVIERASGNFSAYAPDIPGCITTGPTIEATLENGEQPSP
jgi:predicted RNase H-like HicB family nuclease